MPEAETITETPTAAALALKATNDAALKQVAGGGFDDPSFEAEMQAAIDKDLGKAPEKREPEPDAKAAAEKAAVDAAAAKAAEKKLPPVDDGIPPALMGEKPTAEKKVEPTPEAAEAERKQYIAEQTKGMSPKAAARFETIEARAFKAEQTARKLEAERVAEKAAVQKQIEEINQQAADKVDEAEVVKLRKQVEELDAVVQKSSLQEHPNFKAKYDGQISTEIEKVKKVVPTENADELAQLLSIPESKKRNERITEIANALEDIPKLKLLAAVERVDRWASEKSDELSKWKENKVHIEASAIRDREIDSAKVAEIQKVAWTKGMDVVSAPQTGLEVFQKADGYDDWNAKVDARVATVKNLLLTKNPAPEKMVELVARAVAADDYRQMFMNQRIKLQQVTAELEELKKADPNAGDTDGDPSGGAEDKDDFVTAAVKASVRAGALRE